MNNRYPYETTSSSDENSDTESYTSEEELHTTDDVVMRVKSDIRNGKCIVIGFMSRFCKNFVDELAIICADPQMKKLLDPIIANGDNGGDLEFRARYDVIVVTITPINEFIGDQNPIIRLVIDLTFFDIFCEAVKEVAMFLSDDQLLSSI